MDGFDGFGLKRSFVGIDRGMKSCFGGGMFGFSLVNFVVDVEIVFSLRWRGLWMVILIRWENFVVFIFFFFLGNV